MAAEVNDNAGNRRKKIREALFEQLGIQDDGGLFTTYEFTWRGTKREVELLYENVREMTDDRLRGRSGRGRWCWTSRSTSGQPHAPTTWHAWTTTAAATRARWSGCPRS
jgi:hypothetical protein